MASLVSTGWQYECIMMRAVVLFAFVAILPYSSDAQLPGRMVLLLFIAVGLI